MSAVIEEFPLILDVSIVSSANDLLIAKVTDLWRASLDEPVFDIGRSTDAIIAGTYNSEVASAAYLGQEIGCIYALSRLVTAQEFQKLGFGSKVLKVAEDEVAARGGRCMQFFAPNSAVNFFETRGYHRTGIGMTDGKGLRHQMQKVITNG